MMKSWQRITFHLRATGCHLLPHSTYKMFHKKHPFCFEEVFACRRQIFFQALPHSTEANSNLVPEQEELLTGCNNSVVTTPPCCFISKAVTSLLVQHTSLRVRPVTTLCSVFWFFYSHISY